MNRPGPIPCSTGTHTSTRPAHCSCSACPIPRAPGRWWSERGGGSRSSRSPCARSSCSCCVAASAPVPWRSPTRRALGSRGTPPGTVHSSAEVTPPLERAAHRPRRLYALVAACAVVVYLGALWNRFAVDDLPIIVLNPLVADPAGMWRAFAAPYWSADLGGHMYRPLVIASFALDHLIDGTAWFHAVNLLWHAGVAVAVAALARRWTDDAGALVAGLLFAVHPLHVEAVANVLGRAVVRHPFAAYESIAPMFVGESPLTVRLTGLYGLADVARLLVFPLTLRVDYSPAERTVVTTPLDPRFLAGLACALIWGALLWLAWKRGRKLEAFGLGWIGIALLPVANLLYPAGFYLAERTLYLPSVGLVIAAAAWLGRLPREALRPVVAALVLLGGIRTALRVPVWRDDAHVTRSVLGDSPRSYVGHKRMIGLFLDRRQPALALDAARVAARLYQRDAGTYVTGSVAAFAAGDVRAADSLLTGLERLCHGGCSGYYRSEAAVALAHGYPEAADSLLARAVRLPRPR